MDSNALENAGEIIERFGGIRPMAKKIDIAVTTVQGWKKRNVIPGTRRELVLQAAATHNVDLSDIINQPSAAPSSAANENAFGEQTAPASVPTVRVAEFPQQSAAHTVPRAAGFSGELDQKLAETENRAVKKSTWINAVIIVLVVAAVAVLLWPGQKQDAVDPARIDTLEENVGELRGVVDEVKSEQSFLSTLIPRDLDDRIAKLQDQARETQEKVSAALVVAGEVSQDVLGENAGTMDQRMQKLGEHIAVAAATPEMAALLSRFNDMRGSLGGDGQLDQAVAELSVFLSSMQGQPVPDGSPAPSMTDMLESARSQSPTLGQAFEGVAPQDMKAAALLLAMTQFRQSLNRDNAPFEDDLQLVRNLVGEDNPELLASLDRLAPQAQSGVLTPAGLSDEFRTMAGEAVVASLKGEDVSLEERAQASVNKFFAVEKNGELITGTPEQATMAKAEKLLNEGNIESAIAEVETLDGPAALVAAEWLSKAKATLSAEQLKTMLNQGVEAVASGQTTLIQNKELGINVLKQESGVFGPRKMDNPFQP